MKILQINQCHYRRGGADIVYLNTINLLRERGHHVSEFSTINSLNENSSFEKYFVQNRDLRKDTLVNKIGSILPYFYNKEAYQKLRLLITNQPPDVAHIHLFYGSLSVSVLNALKDSKIPIVHTVHDYRLLCPVHSLMDSTNELCEECAKSSAISCIKKRCSDGKLTQSIIVSFEALYWKKINNPVSEIDTFHFVSNFCKRKHLEYLPQIEDKSRVFYNYSPIKINYEHNLNMRYYLYYGRLSTEKGIKTLLQSWSHLPNRFKLKIVGTGYLADELIELSKILRMNNIEFLGFKNGAELYNLIKGARFIIVPSEWYENNPMAIVESFSLGKPVIGTNIGGITELINENETGFLCTPKSVEELKGKIEYAESLSDSEYENISNNCLEFAYRNFSEDQYYDKLISMYEDTINNQ